MSDDLQLKAQKIADAVFEALRDEIGGYANEYSGDPDRTIEDCRRYILEAVKQALANE